MQNSHAKAIRGLNIAVLVLALIGLVGCAIALVGLILGSTFAMIAFPFEIFGNSVNVYGSPFSNSDALGVAGLTGIGFIIGVFSIVFSSAATIFYAIVGYTCMKSYEDYDKYGLLFGLSLAGAIVSLVFGSFITLILLIISTVFIGMDKKAYQNGTLD